MVDKTIFIALRIGRNCILCQKYATILITLQRIPAQNMRHSIASFKEIMEFRTIFFCNTVAVVPLQIVSVSGIIASGYTALAQR